MPIKLILSTLLIICRNKTIERLGTDDKVQINSALIQRCAAAAFISQAQTTGIRQLSKALKHH